MLIPDSPAPFDPKTSPTGKGIGIAFLDTGISPVADFTQPQNRIVAFRDFIDGKKQAYDNNGHGTHLTGGNDLSLYSPKLGVS